MRIILGTPLLLATLATVFLGHRAVATGLPPPSFNAIQDPAGQRLEAALGIKTTTADFMSAYAKAVAAYVNHSPQAKERVRDLVKAIIHGATPLLLYRLRIYVSNVAGDDRHVKNPLWHYGSPSEENAFGQLVLADAQAMRRSRPRLAAEYAKAALICFHADYFDVGDALLGMELDQPKVDFRHLARLSHRRRRAFRRYYDWSVDTHRASMVYSSRVGARMATLQSHFVKTRKVGAIRLARFLRISTGALRHPGTDPIFLHIVLAVDWQVFNIARHCGDARAKGRIRAFFRGIKRSDRRPWVVQWAGQALRERGPMPFSDILRVPASDVHPSTAGMMRRHH